jgi:hypothetical protein
MHESIDTVFTAGVIVGAVLATTLLVVPAIRYVVLLVATCTIATVYVRGGVAGLIVYVTGMQTEIVSKPIFSAGMLTGAVAIAVFRLRRQPAA